MHDWAFEIIEDVANEIDGLRKDSEELKKRYES